MTSGGLWGTYYDQPEFSLYSYQQVEREIRFDWGYWGPDAQKLTPASFSIRYHGWIMMDDTRDYRFSLKGNGKARMILGGETVVDWGFIDGSPSSRLISMEEGVAVPICIYYSNDDLGQAEIASSLTLLSVTAAACARRCASLGRLSE